MPGAGVPPLCSLPLLLSLGVRVHLHSRVRAHTHWRNHQAADSPSTTRDRRYSFYLQIPPSWPTSGRASCQNAKSRVVAAISLLCRSLGTRRKMALLSMRCARTHTHTHTHTHALSHSYIHTLTQSHTQKRGCTRERTRTHTRTHTLTHMHMIAWVLTQEHSRKPSIPNPKP